MPIHHVWVRQRGEGVRRTVVHRPAPLTDIFPVIWSLGLVFAILGGLTVAGWATDNPAARVDAEPIILGEKHAGYRFREIDPVSRDGVRYNPCSPVTYVIDPDLAPPGVVDDVHAAFGEVAAATGLEFVFEGLTDERPTLAREAYQPGRYGERWAPVLVSFHHFGENVLDATPLAEAGSVSRRNAEGKPVYVTGRVQLNADAPGVKTGFGPGRTWGKILMHEIGHLVGLGHVGDQTSLMYPATTEGPTRLSPGDRVGLARLGRSEGCLATPAPDSPTVPG